MRTSDWVPLLLVAYTSDHSLDSQFKKERKKSVPSAEIRVEALESATDLNPNPPHPVPSDGRRSNQEPVSARPRPRAMLGWAETHDAL